MKTAPKDEQILIADDYGEGICVTQGRWIDVPHSNELTSSWTKGGTRNAQEIPCEGRWMGCHAGIMDHGGACSGQTWEARPFILFHPVGWMPLPKPPKMRRK